MSYKYKFSVIVPVYNVENYLDETVESVINQSIGFKKNIQLILVNDGSTDGSADICLKYKNTYPENIVFIDKKNGGVSSARNAGIEYIEGKYVNFLDSDDKWTENSFKIIYNFFEKHYDEIDVVACRVKFFEAKDDYHALDYKFANGTRVADLTNEEELFTVQSTTATAFIKSSAIGDIRFDTELKYGEDSTFINKIILKKCKVGENSEALYLYRRRASGDSAVNVQIFDKAFYTTSLTKYHLELFRYSEELYGEVIPYIQSVVGYDIMWRFDYNEIHRALTDEEYNEFLALAKKLLDRIDDNILINSPRHKSIVRKSEVFRLKYNIDFLKELEYDQSKLSFRGYEVLDFKNKSNLFRVSLFNIQKNKCRIEVFVADWLLNATKNGAKFCLKVGKKFIKPKEIKGFSHSLINSESGKKRYCNILSFEFKLNTKDTSVLKIRPYLVFENGKTPVSFSYIKFIPSANGFAPNYQINNNYVIRYLRTVIKLYKSENISKERKRLELKCISYLIKNKKFNEAKIRINTFLFKKKNKNKGEIWLISDRIDNAGDNGEVFFKYVCEHKPEGVRPIFVIGEAASSEVKERLNNIGEVIYFESKEYPCYFLSAKKIISSSGADFTTNPFGKDRRYFQNLYCFKYYYLQHGVTCADLSSWLNRYSKNIYRFYVSGEKEKEAILKADYYYTEKQVVLTGQARFDALYNDPQKQLLILPTWRRSIKQSYDEKTSSVYFDGFKETEYFKFYNSLINDERLLKVMREKGYKGLFCLHPIHMKQYVDFCGNDVFSVNEGFIDYNKVFAESSVMVTDYSSVLFDYAYLRKPVVYAQFDKEEFYEGQIYDEGYFKYERDGFGKVCYNLDDTVNELIRLVENDCINSEEYLNRVNSFFAFNDKNNSKRILENILETDK